MPVCPECGRRRWLASMRCRRTTCGGCGADLASAPRSLERFVFIAVILASASLSLIGVEREWWFEVAALVASMLLAFVLVAYMSDSDTGGGKPACESGSSTLARVCSITGAALLLLVYLCLRLNPTPSAELDNVLKALFAVGLGLMLVWQFILLFGRNGMFRGHWGQQ